MTTVKMDIVGVMRRINEYVTRAKKQNYPLPDFEKKGDYLIIQGSGLDHGKGALPEIYQGRFIDVLVRAIQMSEFYGEWCNTDNMLNPNHGHIELYKPKKVEKVPVTKNIVTYLRMQKQTEKELRLEEKLGKPMTPYDKLLIKIGR